MAAKGAGQITASGCYKCAEGELSELEVAAARRNFQAYDLDGDGVISREDFHQAMSKYKEQLGHRTPAELDEMYASVDIHGTGQVDFLTFAEMRVRKKNHTATAVSSAYPGEEAKGKKPPMKTWQSTPAGGEAAATTGGAPPAKGSWWSTQLSALTHSCSCFSKEH